MMSKLSIFLASLAALAVGLIFLSSTAVQRLTDRLDRLQGEIAAEREQIEVLEADWAFLNRPARLEALAKRYLDLVPARADQFGTLAGISLRYVPGTGDGSETGPDSGATDQPHASGDRPADSSYLHEEQGRRPEVPELPTVMVDVRAGAGETDEPLMISWGRGVRLPPASEVGDEIGVLIATLGGR